jgi:hypothetical protein
MAFEALPREKRQEVLRIAGKYGAHSVRVFGSVARGEADAQSDVDFLVELESGRSLFDLGGLQFELEALLGRPVDVVTERGLKARIRERVFARGRSCVRDPNERLRVILEAIAAIERHLDCDKAALEQDELRQAWFLRQLQIIGEATRSRPAEVRALATEIPWCKIVGMRNVLVPGYFGIDIDIMWQAATKDVAALNPAILALLGRIENPP